MAEKKKYSLMPPYYDGTTPVSKEEMAEWEQNFPKAVEEYMATRPPEEQEQFRKAMEEERKKRLQGVVRPTTKRRRHRHRRRRNYGEG